MLSLWFVFKRKFKRPKRCVFRSGVPKFSETGPESVCASTIAASLFTSWRGGGRKEKPPRVRAFRFALAVSFLCKGGTGGKAMAARNSDIWKKMHNTTRKIL